MSWLSQGMIATAFASLILCGCTRVPKPLTDRSIELMSNSRYAIAYIDYNDGRQLELNPKEYETMRSLFRTLSPIRASRPGTISNPDYSLSYQGGMDPTTVHVKLTGDELEFGLGHFIHFGGDAKAFLDLIPEPPEI